MKHFTLKKSFTAKFFFETKDFHPRQVQKDWTCTKDCSLDSISLKAGSGRQQLKAGSNTIYCLSSGLLSLYIMFTRYHDITSTFKHSILDTDTLYGDPPVAVTSWTTFLVVDS